MQTDLIGVIILAAGESKRLGEPKQLLRWQGETLLRRAAKAALGVSSRVVVALGSKIELTRLEVENLPVEIVENKDWISGMSGSLKVGLEKLLAGKNLQAVIVMVCDQPFVNQNLLEKIIKKFEETAAPIVCCKYENALGVPALFSEEIFPELLALDAQTGAKLLIRKYAAQTAAIAFPEGTFDIDTPSDIEILFNHQN